MYRACWRRTDRRTRRQTGRNRRMTDHAAAASRNVPRCKSLCTGGQITTTQRRINNKTIYLSAEQNDQVRPTSRKNNVRNASWATRAGSRSQLLQGKPENSNRQRMYSLNWDMDCHSLYRRMMETAEIGNNNRWRQLWLIWTWWPDERKERLLKLVSAEL